MTLCTEELPSPLCPVSALPVSPSIANRNVHHSSDVQLSYHLSDETPNYYEEISTTERKMNQGVLTKFSSQDGLKY